jgi:succinate dehydrogenase / fumarate reductase, cytochrome b subunit
VGFLFLLCRCATFRFDEPRFNPSCRVNLFTFFWKSSIGKKWLVALTGLVLVGYVVGHMIGNLQIFGDPKQINGYAEFLHSMPGALWAVRVFLLVCFVLHIVTTIKLVAENRAARPEGYQKKAHVQATWASRLMALSGLTVLAFVIFHILHFTTRTVDPSLRAAEHGGKLTSEFDVHTMVVAGFKSSPLITGFYILGLFLLCLHLSHGFSSLLQTFGLNSKKTMAPISHGGRILAWLIFVGYVSIPLAVWLGWLNFATVSK